MFGKKRIALISLLGILVLVPAVASAQRWDGARCEKYCTEKGRVGKGLGACIQTCMFNHKDDATREVPFNRKKCETDKRAC